MLPTLRYAAALGVVGLATTMCGEITKTFSNDCAVIPMDGYQWDAYQLTFDHSTPEHCPVPIGTGSNIVISGTWTDGGVPDFLTGLGFAINQPDGQVLRQTIIQFQEDDGKWVGQAAMNYTAATGVNRCLDVVTQEMAIYSNGQPVLNHQPQAMVRVTYHWYNDYPHCDPDGGGDNIIVGSRNSRSG